MIDVDYRLEFAYLYYFQLILMIFNIGQIFNDSDIIFADDTYIFSRTIRCAKDCLS